MTATMMEKAPHVPEAELVAMGSMMAQAIDQVQMMEEENNGRVPRATNLLAENHGPQAQSREEWTAERRAERLAGRVALRDKEKQARRDWKTSSRTLKAKRAEEQERLQEQNQSPKEMAADIAGRVALRDKEKQARRDWKTSSRTLKAKRAEEKEERLQERNQKAEERRADRIASRGAIEENEKQSMLDLKATSRPLPAESRLELLAAKPHGAVANANGMSSIESYQAAHTTATATADGIVAQLTATWRDWERRLREGKTEVISVAGMNATVLKLKEPSASAIDELKRSTTTVTPTVNVTASLVANLSANAAMVAEVISVAGMNATVLKLKEPRASANEAMTHPAASSSVVKGQMNVTKLKFKESKASAKGTMERPNANVSVIEAQEKTSASWTGTSVTANATVSATTNGAVAMANATFAEGGAKKSFFEHTMSISSVRTAKASPNMARSVHAHIPSLLSFTYKCDLLVENRTCLDGRYDEALLRQNVWNTIHVHGGDSCTRMADDCPASSCLSCASNVMVRFFDDDACARVIGEVAPEALLRHFHNEYEGMHKAEMCRAALLQRDGGIYFDADLKARMDVRTLIAADSTFVGARSRNSTFFRGFMAAAPRSAVINRYLDHLVAWFDRRNAATSVGMNERPKMALTAAWQRAVSDDAGFLQGQAQLWVEIPRSELDEAHRKWVPQADNSCDTVIIDEVSGKVPFYSRAIGSGPEVCTTKRHVRGWRSDKEVANSLLGQ